MLVCKPLKQNGCDNGFTRQGALKMGCFRGSPLEAENKRSYQSKSSAVGQPLPVPLFHDQPSNQLCLVTL